MTRRMSYLALLAAVVLAGGAAQRAEAKYLTIFEEVDPDVVETGGGTLDLTNLKLTAAALSHAFVSPDTAAYVSGVPGVFGYSFLGNITGSFTDFHTVNRGAAAVNHPLCLFRGRRITFR